MLEVLQFIFSSAWVFLGTLLLMALAIPIAAIVVKGVVAVFVGVPAMIMGRNFHVK